MARGRPTPTQVRDAIERSSPPDKIAGEFFDPMSVLPAESPSPATTDRVVTAEDGTPEERGRGSENDEPLMAEIRVPISTRILPTEFGLQPTIYLQPATATKLRKITAALVAAGSRLSTGQPVRNYSDALVFMLEAAQIRP